MTPAILLLLAAMVPPIDLPSACHGQEKALPQAQRQNAYRDCMQAEQTALTSLQQNWTKFPAAARRPSADLAQTFDSYVELLVCIEIRAGVNVADLGQK